MENLIGNLTAMWPVYVLFITSGLIIFIVSSWVGEALLSQIKENKTSIFGKSDSRNLQARTMYVPPAQMAVSGLNQKNAQPRFSTLPAIPNRPQTK